MKRNVFVNVIVLVIILLPLCYLFYVYPKMPAIVPTHFGINGKPNRFDPKSKLVLIECVIIGISLLTYLLMKFMPVIDPKRYNQLNQSRYQKLGVGVVVFMAVLATCMTYATIEKTFDMEKVIIALMGALFVFIGNLMYNIKPNYFAGIRTPWALENEDNWRATHHVAGKVFVTGGIIITFARLVLPLAVGMYIFFIGLGIIAIVPIAYSYMYFKKHHVK